MTETASSETLIRLNGVKKVFLADEVETHALSNIHLEIKRGEYVTIAVGWRVPVGVDIELVDRRVDALSFAARFFRAEEHRHLQGLEGKARDRAFFRMWTQKEASLKATGIGIRGLDDSTSLLGTSSVMS